ncbi:hypothetical protein HMI55_005466 [Coelomomyces lativittatus]|nr:hypothetical protein HMI55_005466 [Coelomomyces lativittatus]
MLFTLIPILTVFFDWPIMPVTPGNTKTLVFLLVPYLFVTRAVIYVMYWNVEDSMTARNRDFQGFLWMSPFLCVALVKFFFSGLKETNFKVTNASSNASRYFSPFVMDLLYCWYHILYISLGVTALGRNTY